MSSLRNAVKRITHKERAQPRSRNHLGILEKKKDYKQRAVDYHRKEDRINAMKEKASMRNPDEFYFGMHNAEVKEGKHRKTEAVIQKERDLGPELIRIMKDQDLSYVRTQKQKDMKKVERLKSSLQFLSDKSDRKHTIFVETQAEADQFDVVEHFDTLPGMEGRAFNRPRRETLRQEALNAVGQGDGEQTLTEKELKAEAALVRKHAKQLRKAREAGYRELEARAKRVRAMERAEAHLVTEKLVAGKGRKRKIKDAEGGRPAQYKWRRKRLG